MTIITKKRLIAAGVLSALIAGNMAMAADVPAGVQLAEKQTLVRNSGAEPQSLDPNKIEGVPEANISRDLFEGLLNTSPNAGACGVVCANDLLLEKVLDGSDSYELAQGDQLVMAAGTYSHPDRGTPFDEVNREYTGEEKRNRIRIGLKNRNGSTRGGC